MPKRSHNDWILPPERWVNDGNTSHTQAGKMGEACLCRPEITLLGGKKRIRATLLPGHTIQIAVVPLKPGAAGMDARFLR